MKVLFVNDATTLSGAEVVLLGCVDALVASGHAAHGFVSANNPRLIEAFRHRGVPCTASRSFSSRLIRTTANPVDLLTFARSFSAVSGEMAAVIRTADVDVIHSISYPASLYAALAAGRTGIPHIWHEHNIKRIHRANRLIYRQIGNACAWVIGPSDAVTNNLRTAGIKSSKVRTVYNGIDLRRFRNKPGAIVNQLRCDLGLQADEQAVGLFGQMLPYKGHRTLIEAAPQILQAHPRARFYFIGALENPPYQQELHALLSQLGLNDRMHFTGWRDSVQDLIGAMDVVVVATTTPEPAALMLMEAGAMERPVVATRTGGTPEIVVDEETGLLFSPGDANHLAQQVGRILSDRDLGRTLGKAARTRVEKEFDGQGHLDAMFELYRVAASLPLGTFSMQPLRQAVSATVPRGQ